jgi:hypothetical protein
MLWALQWTDTDTGETTLCEVERHVVYECGSQLKMRVAACKHNRSAIENDWSSRYRAVPLPFTGDMPDWVAR